jgi:6-pyruvoyltetrahydropterin/6-carboxytetrahydropterin synthase
VHEVSVWRHFYATHQLRNHPADADGPHRHRWEVRVIVRTPDIAEVGFGLDFVILDAWLADALARIDGRNLNEIEPFDRINPSAENLATWIWGEIAPRAAEAHTRLSRVEVYEGPRFCAAYWEDSGMEPGRPRGVV